MLARTDPSPRRRTLDALAIVADQYGIAGDLAELEQTNAWEPAAVAMLAEAVAGLLLEVRPRSSKTPVRKGPAVPGRCNRD